MHSLETLLANRVSSLQRSQEDNAEVNTHLRDIAVWLRRAPFSTGMAVYTQGSVRLGTSISPVARSGFDADLVCQLPRYAWESCPSAMFEMVGGHLLQLPGFQGAVKRKRRCWTLVYSPRFHVDVTPAIIHERSPGEEVWVFDGPSQDWRISNPVAYASWFQAKQNSAICSSAAPLVAAVQLLKRRRDLLFDSPDAPNSIVLTTLAASLYSGEQTIVATLSKVIRGMLAVADALGSRMAVANPVNPSEVFSENWTGNAAAAKLFSRYLKDLQTRLARTEITKHQHRAAWQLDELFGARCGSLN
ncbi:MAG: nucleotidyltransferase [Acidobacteriia bacterium]|nr:nucleotidyltransferase [Terriglobia bacterium]